MAWGRIVDGAWCGGSVELALMRMGIGWKWDGAFWRARGGEEDVG